MAKVKISEFSANPANNTDIDGINIAENCAPSGINDAIRELMAQLKDFQAGTAGDSFNGPVGTTTAAAGAFTTLTTSSTVTHNGGTANGVAYLNGSKVLTTGSALTFDGTTMTVPSDIASPGSPILYSYNGGSAGSVRAGIQLVGTDPSIRSYISGSEQMRLTSTGLGIGTSSPSAKLQVADGNILLSNAYSLSARNAANTTSIALILRNTSDQVVIDADGYGLKMGAGGALFLNGSGNLGLGVTPSAWATGTMFGFQIGSGAAFAGDVGLGYRARILANAYYGSGAYRYIGSGPALLHTLNANSSTYEWNIAGSGTAGNAISFTQALTLDANGSLLVGFTAGGLNNSGSMQFTPGTSSYGGVLTINHSTSNVSGSGYINFGYNGSAIGSVSQNGTTAVAYNTSSDYRLKNTIAPMTGALAKVALLKPCTYKWNADGSDGEGFIAHELAEVCPQAVTGEKDAVDADGNPQYQGIDTSFLVATLTAAIQELKAEFDAYKASHP